MLLYKLMGMTSPLIGEKFGVELEVEGAKLPNEAMGIPYWQVTIDNSLRNNKGQAYEYKSEPISLSTLKLAMASMENAANYCKSESEPSFRTSTHVHVNMLDMDINEIASFVAIYLIYEHSFYELIGKEREGNLFAVPLVRCQRILQSFAEFIRAPSRKLLSTLLCNNNKYAALNIGVLFAASDRNEGIRGFGTLEARAHEGVSLKELDRVVVWANILGSIRRYSKTKNDPTEVLGQVSILGFYKFAETVFGEDSKLLKIDTYAAYEGLDAAQIFAYCKNWEEKEVCDLPEKKDVIRKVIDYEKPSKEKAKKVLDNLVVEAAPEHIPDNQLDLPERIREFNRTPFGIITHIDFKGRYDVDNFGATHIGVEQIDDWYTEVHETVNYVIIKLRYRAYKIAKTAGRITETVSINLNMPNLELLNAITRGYNIVSIAHDSPTLTLNLRNK